jgi:hypothetical protein
MFISNPSPDLELTPEHALKLIKPLYGLADSRDFWYRELAQHHRIMGMLQLTTDSSLRLIFTDNVLQGLSDVYVDDVVQAGTPTFDRLSDSLGDVYDAKNKEYGDGRIAGIQFYCDKDGMRVNQSQYLRSLKLLPADADFDEFRSTRMKLAWLVHSRPDVSYGAAIAAQVTPEQFSKSTCIIKRLNAIIKRLYLSPEESMRFPTLNAASQSICVFCDVSFANNKAMSEDMSSQMGYIALWVDDKNRCAPLAFKSSKCK